MNDLIVNVLGLSIIISLATWRITRFLLLDALIDTPRDQLQDWLEARQDTSRAARYLYTLIGCAFCVSIWVSAGAVGLWSLTTRSWLGWPVIFVWLAGSTGCMIIYRYVDPPQPCLPTRVCDDE